MAAEGQDHTLFPPPCFELLAACASPFECAAIRRALPDDSAAYRKSRFLRELWRFRGGGTRADALQCAMKRWHISDLHLISVSLAMASLMSDPGLLSLSRVPIV